MNRRIVVHAGLPKTGTSAIQSWLHHHRSALADEGVYCPPQGMDENDIGPGNPLALLERGDTSGWQPSQERVDATLEKFDQRDQSTLLLSSEFFAAHIRALGKMMPEQTRFVAYVRDPIEFRSSNYNQGVKRAGFTHKFNSKGLGKMGETLLPFMEEWPRILAEQVDLVLRPYHSELFAGGSILHDLFDASGITMPREGATFMTSSGRVNTSYTLHALEFKRSANRLPLRKAGLQGPLDVALQQCELGPREYSLIPPAELARLRAHVDAEFCTLEDVHGITALAPLRELLEHEEGRPYRRQHVLDVRIGAVAGYLREEHATVFRELRQLVKASPDVEFPYEGFRKAFA